MNSRSIYVVSGLLLAWAVCPVMGENLVRNSGFEQADGVRPAAWASHTWAGEGAFAHVEEGRDGSACVRIDSKKGGDLSWEHFVDVDANSTYRLSGWIKTKDLHPSTGKGAMFNVHLLPNAFTPPMTGTRDWTRVERIIRSGKHKQLQVNCLFGGWGLATGTIWFDDVTLEKIDLAKLEPEITIQARATGERIDPFIYGQFIEHLGRCIYGGIWAEMLEDRKFYFPITPDYDPYRESHGIKKDAKIPVVGASPWQIMGDAGSVKMVTEDSFVGKHTPRIQPSSGIAQRDLGVVKGQDYTGHIQLKPEGGPARVSVTLMWRAGKSKQDLQTVTVNVKPGAYARHEFRFTAQETTDKASLIIRVEKNPCLVGTVSLMPADNVNGLRADTLALLKELNAPMYRWPGGNFVSGYNWRDGIGDRDRRPPRKNPAWTGVEHNDFGLDEFIALCRLLDTEPLIAANTGFGDSYSAAQEVEYCNGGADTIGGSWRIKHGHSDPYNVTWWCVGNEMFGAWQLGYMKLGHYVLKHNEVAEAMLQADPGLKLIGVGDAGPWSQGMLKGCADSMDLISEHFYVWKETEDVVAHVAQIKDQIKRKADAHRVYRKNMPQLKGKDIRIAMDEWNYWYKTYEYGELGCVYRLRDALGVAAGLHEYYRNSDIITMAHYAQTVNVIGCIKTTKTQAGFSTTALPLMLYRERFGSDPVKVAGNAGLLGLDIVAAWTHDEKRSLTVGVVNPLPVAKTIRVYLEGATLEKAGKVWRISGDNPLAFNEPGKDPQVVIHEESVEFDGSLNVPALSVNVYTFKER